MKLKKLEIKAGGGINPSSPVIIDFSESKFVSAKGDNGSGKTSTIEGLLYALMEIGGKKFTDRYKNNETGTIDIDLEFTGSDRRDYHVRATKSDVKVTYEGDKNALPEPMALLRRLLGPTGVSPIDIKNKPINEIIKWLAAYSTKNPEDFEKALQKNKDGVKKAQEARAAANKSAKGVMQYLIDEGIANDKGEIIEKVWTNNEKKYAAKVDISKLSTQLDEAGKKSDAYLKAVEKVKNLEKVEADTLAEIAQLQERLAETQKNLKNGKKYLEDNKSAKTEFDNVKAKYDTAAADAVGYSRWQDTKKKKKELDEYQDVAQKADTLEKDLLAERREMQAEILPDLKGMELVLEDTHEDGGKMVKAGLYRDGVSSVQMSTGEWIKTVIEMFKKNKIKIIVVDNAEMLGSEGYDLLKTLSEKFGCYILVGEVARGKKELELSYS